MINTEIDTPWAKAPSLHYYYYYFHVYAKTKSDSHVDHHRPPLAFITLLPATPLYLQRPAPPTSTDLRHQPKPTTSTDLCHRPPLTFINLHRFYPKDVNAPLWRRRLVSGGGHFVHINRGFSKISFLFIMELLCAYWNLLVDTCQTTQWNSRTLVLLECMSHHAQTYSSACLNILRKTAFKASSVILCRFKAHSVRFI